MRRYLATKRCLWCGGTENVQEDAITVSGKSIIVSFCSPLCLKALKESASHPKSFKKLLSLRRF